MDSWWDVLVFVAVIVVTMAGLLGTAMVFEFAGCKSKARGLELEYTWGPLQGCLVARRDGVMVPIDNYGRSDRE